MLADDAEHHRGRTANEAIGGLMPLLRGHGALWHRATVSAARAIFATGAIIPNDGGLPSPYPANSYGRILGAVNLFDFDTPAIGDLYWSAINWARFLTDCGPATVWLKLDRDRLDRQLLVDQSGFVDGLPPTHVDASGTRYTPRFIPQVEVWYAGRIAVAGVRAIVVFRRACQPHDYEICTPTAAGVERAVQLSAAWEAAEAEIRHGSKAGGGTHLAAIVATAISHVRGVK